MTFAYLDNFQIFDGNGSWIDTGDSTLEKLVQLLLQNGEAVFHIRRQRQ